MKVTFEGKEYTIDLEKAKELGVLKEPNTIKDIKVGDVFLTGLQTWVMIVENGYSYNQDGKESRWNIAGLNGLRVYSDFGHEGLTKTEMLKWLNDCYFGKGARFIKNLNADIDKLIKDLRAF